MKETQCERILRHLTDYGTITPLEAMGEYGIMRLASRITDLKKQGYAIKTTFGKGRNRYGERTHFAVYQLATENQNQKESIQI